MSLRLRLLVGLLALVAIGITITDSVTYLSLQSSLSQQIDNQLTSSVNSVYHCLQVRYSNPNGHCFGVYVPPGTYGELVPSTGGPTVSIDFENRTNTPRPRLGAAVTSGVSSGARYSTVPATSGGGEFRVLTGVLGPGFDFVIAMPLTNVDDTLSQLRLLELLVSLAVLLGIAALAWWTVQLSLRPLARIRATARAIADGDLSRRVEVSRPGTEVGQLAVSLNEMLSQIERAFEARAASEARMRQFMADASHELRTPLSSIRGYAELFRHGARGRPEDLDKAMSRIESESARMTQLVDDLILLARLDEGRPLQSAPVDFSQLAVDAAADASVADRNHKIRVDAPDPVMVVGDEPRLRQVINNLVRNAMAHTPAGTLVEVSVRSLAGGAELRVTDHGPGVSEEAASKVFERFVRLDQSRSREHGGAGLGLAIVAAIVGAHHGSVRLEPTPGGGATFIVRLPQEPPPSLPGGSPAPAGPTG